MKEKETKRAKLIALASDPAAFAGEREVALRKAADLTEPASLRVTEKSADTLPAPPTGSRIYRETGHDQLGLRVTAANARSWTLDYSCRGIQRRYTIGPRHALSLKAAITEAKRLQGLVAQGIDPFDVKAADRIDKAAKREAERRAKDPDADPTVRHLTEKWIADAERHLRPAAIVSARSCLRVLKRQKFDQRKVREVTWRDVKALMAAMHKTPTMANRIRSFLSAVYGFGIAHGIGLTEDSVNPARRLKNRLIDNVETPRDVTELTRQQIDALYIALDKRAVYPSTDAIRLLLWTGARKMEVLQLEWSEIDDLHGEHPRWLLPALRAKQKRDRMFPLADPQVLALFRRLHAKTGAGRYVFPGKCAGKPLRDIYHLWSSVRREAGLRGFRMHDFRHDFISRGLNAGGSIWAVGGLVGHSSSYMTSRYGHLSNEAASNAAKLIGGTLAQKPSAATIPAETNGASA
jgi:integrase